MQKVKDGWTRNYKSVLINTDGEETSSSYLDVITDTEAHMRFERLCENTPRETLQNGGLVLVAQDHKDDLKSQLYRICDGGRGSDQCTRLGRLGHSHKHQARRIDSRVRPMVLRAFPDSRRGCS